jgi:hypothetical protein
MESKIRIKMGQVEIDFEGSESFLKEEMLGFLKAVAEIASTSQLAVAPSLIGAQNSPIEQDNPNQSGSTITGTTNSIAAKLKVKSGTDLIMAAAAHFTFVKGQDKFHRKDLLDEIKSASTYYKKTYSNNMSTYLDTLVKSNQLTEQSTDTYAIPAEVRNKLEATLV